MSNYNVDQVFKYHEPKPGQPEMYETIRVKAKDLARAILSLAPDSVDHDFTVEEVEAGTEGRMRISGRVTSSAREVQFEMSALPSSVFTPEAIERMQRQLPMNVPLRFDITVPKDE